MKPSDYDLPHDEWRKGQESATSWCIDTEEVGILEACTGSGKSALAAATGSQKSVVVLTRTKNLQAQYGDVYDFSVLYGRLNYKCAHPDAPTGATGADCLHEDNMYRCPVARSCEYLIRKAEVQASSRAALNYSYFLTASWVRENPPQVVFADEAHQLAETIVGFCGCTITDRDRVEWGLSEFPELKPAGDGGMFVKVVDPVPVALGWLEDARNVLRREWRTLKHATTKGQLTRKRKCERVGRKVSNTLDALRGCPDDWYIRSGQRAQKYGREWRPAFVCRPLTARHHAPGYFMNGHATVMMSATIGEPGTFADELGVSEYDFLGIPHQYPVESRQVYVLDVPSMGARAGGSAFSKQADEIADAVKGCPGEWSGFVHVTRKTESKLLADRLARRGLGDRVWVPPGYDGQYEPTDVQMAAWQKRKTRVPNSLCISWAFMTGVDGLDEKINILAKCPFPVWGSNGSYEAAWRGYSMDRYRWATANLMAQALGRTRRGREQDYDTDGEFNGFCAVADNSYKQVRKSLPGDLLESLVE